jgi:hypothetical protein
MQIKMATELIIDNKELRTQMYGVLNSNMSEDIKEGLHNMLSEIDAFTEKGEMVLLKSKTPDYKKAYNILMDYWDSLPDDEKENIDEELKKVGA